MLVTSINSDVFKQYVKMFLILILSSHDSLFSLYDDIIMEMA